MCTLSWMENKTGTEYQLYFNRDEQRTRKTALPPTCFERDGVKMLMPIDPEGGGSWIAVNEQGLSLCLLNYYQGDLPSGQLISRGQLLRSLAHMNGISDLETTLSDLNLNCYAPFTLVAFSHQDNRSKQGFRWDGKRLFSFVPVSPITSSSVKFDEVSENRISAYKQQVKKKTAKELTHFHSAHSGYKNHLSVCMHRKDAKTVSFSHIIVNSAEVVFNYQPGSPCEGREDVVTKINVSVTHQNDFT